MLQDHSLCCCLEEVCLINLTVSVLSFLHPASRIALLRAVVVVVLYGVVYVGCAAAALDLVSLELGLAAGF